MAWAKATFPCLLSGRPGHICRGEKTFHHVREFGSPKNDFRGLVLCCAAHLKGWGPDAIHELGKDRWQERFGVSISAQIELQQQQWILSGREIAA